MKLKKDNQSQKNQAKLVARQTRESCIAHPKAFSVTLSQLKGKRLDQDTKKRLRLSEGGILKCVISWLKEKIVKPLELFIALVFTTEALLSDRSKWVGQLRLSKLRS